MAVSSRVGVCSVGAAVGDGCDGCGDGLCEGGVGDSVVGGVGGGGVDCGGGGAEGAFEEVWGWWGCDGCADLRPFTSCAFSEAGLGWLRPAQV